MKNIAKDSVEETLEVCYFQLPIHNISCIDMYKASHNRRAYVVVEEANLEDVVGVWETVGHVGISLRVPCQNDITPTLQGNSNVLRELW